jgi:mannosyltransferase
MSKVINVVINGDLVHDVRRGVARCFREIILQRPPGIRFVLYDAKNRWRDALGKPDQVRVLSGGKTRLHRALLQMPLCGRLFKRAGLIYHEAFFSRGLRSEIPEVVTVYDMVVEKYPEYCGEWGRRQAEDKAGCIARAHTCMCISQKTADDVAAFYPWAKHKLRVVHLAGEHIVRGMGRWNSAPLIEGGFVLVPGARDGYKNGGAAIQAVQHRDWPTNVKLVLAGPAVSEKEAQLIDTVCGTSRVVVRANPTDEEMGRLIRDACCVLLPSLYEGFGLSVLESQHLSTPVVCSDNEICQEVAGDGAEFCDVRSPEAIAGAVARAISADRAGELRQLGAENVTRFSWKRCAIETAAVYRESLG